MLTKKTKILVALLSFMCLFIFAGTLFLVKRDVKTTTPTEAIDFDYYMNVPAVYGYKAGTVGSKLTLRCSLGTETEPDRASGETQTIAAGDTVPYAVKYGIDANWLYSRRWLQVKAIEEYATLGSSSLKPGKIVLDGVYRDNTGSATFNMTDSNIQLPMKMRTAGDYDDVTFSATLYYNISYALYLHGGTTGDAATDTAFENGTFYTYNTYDQVATAMTALPTRTGYTFKGFYTAESGGTQVIDANGTFLLNQATADLYELHAQWQVNQYTLTADANAGTIAALDGWNGSGTTATKVVTYNTAYGTLPVPTREGYGFKGWFTQRTGGTSIDATICIGAADVTIYAQWNINQYTLTANANGGTMPSTLPSGWNSSSSQTATKSLDYHAQYSTLPEPTRVGYIFMGWFAASSGGSEVNSESQMPASNTIIYAHWIESWISYRSNTNPVLGEDGYYQIDSAETFAQVAYLINHGNASWASANYKLTNSIDLSDHYWQPIGDTKDLVTGTIFSGTIDGATFDIKGMKTYCGANEYQTFYMQGLFGVAQNATIKNIKMYDIQLSGLGMVGAIASTGIDTTFKNCRITGGALVSNNDSGYCGGIASYIMGGTIDGCENYASITGGAVGGITACAITSENGAATISNCVNYGNITASNSNADCLAGGIVSCGDMTIKNCVNRGAVSNSYNAAGGIVDQLSGGSILNCVNEGTVTGNNTVAGIVSSTAPSSAITISNCLNTGNLNTTDSTVVVAGILAGDNSSSASLTINNCYSACTITAPSTAAVAGIAAANMPITISYCAAKLNLTNSTTEVQSFYKSTNTTISCTNSYSLINNGGTEINKVTATNSGMDSNFSIITSIHGGDPVPVGIYHISPQGTTTGIYGYLQSKYNVTT